jgi:hypothetical protein
MLFTCDQPEAPLVCADCGTAALAKLESAPQFRHVVESMNQHHKEKKKAEA